MSLDTNKRFNNMIEELRQTSHPNHTVNIHDLLNALKHSGTATVQSSGQSYTYVAVEDIRHALEEVIATANKTQPSPIIITDNSDFITTIETHLGGLRNAKSLEYRSRGCEKTEYLGKVSITRDALLSNIQKYEDYLTAGVSQ